VRIQPVTAIIYFVSQAVLRALAKWILPGSSDLRYLVWPVLTWSQVSKI